MPRDSTIIALDILPIKPIPGVTTHVADITTDKAHSLIRQSLSGSKVSTVLCDGAPNLTGTAYDRDAYLQNEVSSLGTPLFSPPKQLPPRPVLIPTPRPLVPRLIDLSPLPYSSPRLFSSP